ncbi:MAG TPA: hypothetical protein VHS80_07360 [Chthoniobacterales bacterium]|jgi:hypothetical protein|nr:hypothetical protein [Chthoniobacterales bacterium]
MDRKSSLLAICSGILSVFVSTAALPQRAFGQNKPLWFPFDGKTWFLLGANYPWYNGYRGLDLGPYLGSKTIATVAFNSPRNSAYGRDIQSPSIPIRSGTTGFNADGIAAQLQDMQGIGIHVLRWFFGGDGRSFMLFDQRDNCTGLDSTAAQNVDRVLALAETHQVYLVPVLFDFRFIGGDHWLKFEDGSSGTGRADVVRDPEKRKSLIENFVKPLVKRCAESKAILYWEIMNEAGNVVQGTDPVTGFTLEGNGRIPGEAKVSVVEMQTFLNEVYDAIKSVDPNHLVMPSGLGRPRQLPLVVGRVKADLFGTHYNDDGNDWERIQSVADISSELHRRFGLVLDKPLVMTEGPAEIERHLSEYLQKAYDGGWAGYLAWSYYRIIGYNGLKRYPRIVTSKDATPAGRANADLYRTFNQAHADAVKLGM